MWPLKNAPCNVQVITAHTALPAAVHAGGRVLQSVEEAGLNATAAWDPPAWEPATELSLSALAALPVRSAAKAASTKAVALQHLKVYQQPSTAAMHAVRQFVRDVSTKKCSSM